MDKKNLKALCWVIFVFLVGVILVLLIPTLFK